MIHFKYDFFSSGFELLSPSSDLTPSRDAVDDRFQHTLDVPSGTTMEQLTSSIKELSNDMLNSIYCSMINHIAEAFFTRCSLRYAQFSSNLRTHLKNHRRWAGKRELTFARLAQRCAKSDFCADGRVESDMVISTNNIWRKLTKILVEELSFFKADMSLSLFLGRTSSNFDRVFKWYGDINDARLLIVSHIDIIHHL